MAYAATAPAQVADESVYTVFGTIQEAINGRAAMLGFLAAVVAERFTHQSVMSQVSCAADNHLRWLAFDPAQLPVT